MSRLFAALGFILLATLATAALATEPTALPPPILPWDQKIDPKTGNSYPPGDPVPPVSELPPDDTIFMDSPAPKIAARGGYAGFASSDGTTQALGVGALLVLENGKTGISLSADYVGGEHGVFAYAEGDLKLRFRVPLDKKHIVWGAFGGDINGRGAADPNIDSFLRIQPAGFLGSLFAIKSKGEVICVFHVFAKAGLGIIDNQTHAVHRGVFSDINFNNWVRPSAGGEALARCGTLRVTADAEHIFTLGPAGDTTRGSVEVSKTWPVSKEKERLQLGFFGRGEGIIENAGDGQGPMSIGRAFVGFEARFW